MLLAQMGPEWTFGRHLAVAAADGKQDAATSGASHRYLIKKSTVTSGNWANAAKSAGGDETGRNEVAQYPFADR